MGTPDATVPGEQSALTQRALDGAFSGRMIKGMKLYYPREPDVFRLKGSYLESRFGFLIATFVVAACFFSIFASS